MKVHHRCVRPSAEAAPIKSTGRQSGSRPTDSPIESTGKPIESLTASASKPADYLPTHFIGAASGILNPNHLCPLLRSFPHMPAARPSPPLFLILAFVIKPYGTIRRRDCSVSPTLPTSYTWYTMDSRVRLLCKVESGIVGPPCMFIFHVRIGYLKLQCYNISHIPLIRHCVYWPPNWSLPGD